MKAKGELTKKFSKQGMRNMPLLKTSLPVVKRNSSNSRQQLRRQSQGMGQAKRLTRQRSLDEKRRKMPLIEEFEDIIMTAQSVAGTNNLHGQHYVRNCNYNAAIMDACVKMEYVTPQRSNRGGLNQSIDTAPSPVTPPQPRLLKISAENLVPSPQETQSSTQSFHHITQSITEIKNEKLENADGSDPLYFDTVDTSLEETGKELDLDILIDEIFVKNQSKTVQTENHESATPLPVLNNLRLLCEEGSSLACSQNTCDKGEVCKSQQDEADLFGSSDLTNAELDNRPSPSIHHPNIPCFVQATNIINIGNESGEQKIGVFASQETSSSVPKNLFEVVSSQNKTFSTSTADQNLPANVLTSFKTKNTDDIDLIGNIVAPSNQNKTSAQEAFNEDLELTNSQFLDIDAKCNHIQEKPGSADALLKCTQSKEMSDNFNTSTLQSRKRQQDLGFSIPTAPRLDWLRQMTESGQRLRKVTLELSRLNAMVLRARRTLWAPQSAIKSQQNSFKPNTSHNDNSRYQPFLAQCDQSSAPMNMNDPDWNVS